MRAGAGTRHAARGGARGTLVVAHRGASEDWPENTLAALRAAVRAGAQMVEFDVYQTKDGVFVLMHDATCDRTTDAVAKFGRKEVRVDELTLAQIRTLDAGTWKDPRFAAERVPTLEEALAAVFPAVPMIERKGGAAPALVAELRRLEAVDRVLVQAFDWPWLTAVHEAEPRLAVGALGGKELSDARLAEVAVTGARFVHLGPQEPHRRVGRGGARPRLAAVHLHRRRGSGAARRGRASVAIGSPPIGRRGSWRCARRGPWRRRGRAR
jgi:glycerophosphoryl diester phosphodiesterase